MNKAILLMGPTASGKTALALQVASLYPVEIVSVDSALIYKDMNIGTAKPTIEQTNQVRHHLIDIISPVDNYSVMQFLNDANIAVRDILSRGKTPILVGGTMMYYDALLRGISELPASDPEIRKSLENFVQENGLSQLYRELLSVDPITAKKINPNDRQRIFRALEVFYQVNQPMSKLQANKINRLKDIDFLPLAIIPENRDLLHIRINARFLEMLNCGFVEEVRWLRECYPELTLDCNSMRCVGYKQAWQYLDNVVSYEEFKNSGMASTRQLAKRQMTWLRSMKVINILGSNATFSNESLFRELNRQINLYLH